MDIYDAYLDSDVMDWDEFQQTSAPPPAHEADSFDAYLDSDIMDWDEFQAKTAPPVKAPVEAEHIYAELGLPVPDVRIGKRPEEYTEEMTAKRLGKQAVISVGQGIADIGRFAKATAETRKLDDPMPFPKYTGWERDPTEPRPGPYRGAFDVAAVTTYDQRQFGSILRDIAEIEGADPTPDRMDEEWKKYLASKQKAAVQGAQDFIDMFPEIMEGSSGIVEDALTGMARFLPSMGISAANPIAGTIMTFTQIAGSSYDDYRKQGIDPDKAFNVAIINSLVQTPLEMAGNLLQIRALRNVTKSLGRSVGVGARLERFSGALLAGAVGEGGEEFLQQYPDEISNIYIANPDLTPEEIAQEVWKQMAEITKKGKKAAVTGAVGGLMLTGGVQALSIPTDLSSYVTEKQAKINKEKGVEPEVMPAEGVAPPAPGDPTIESIQAKFASGEFTEEDLEDHKVIFGDNAELVAGIDEILTPKEAPITKAVTGPEMRTTLLAKLKKDRPDISDKAAAKIVDDTIARTEEFIPIEEEAIPAEFSVALAKEEGKVLPGSAAIKIDGKVYGPAQTHLQVIAEVPSAAWDKKVTEGFLTDKGVFVDRRKALTLVPPEVAKGKVELVSEELAEFSVAKPRAITAKLKEHQKLTLSPGGKLTTTTPGPLGFIGTKQEGKAVRVPMLPEIYSHPTIYKDYPELKKYPVRIKKGEKKGGWWQRGIVAGDIQVSAPTTEGLTEVLEHEIYHAIEEIKEKRKAPAPAEFSVAAVEPKITGKEQMKDVKKALKIIKGGKYEYIAKLPKGVLEQAEPVRKEDAEAEVAAQIVAIKGDRFPDQTISTVAEAQDWLKKNGFPQIAEKGETAQTIDSLIKNEEFQKLNIFDQIRVAAQLERPIRNADYRPVLAIGGNKKTKGLLGTKGIGTVEQIEDSGIRVADTIAGCDQYCFECYALKGAARGGGIIAGISHQHPILVKLTGFIKAGEVLRIGEKGDPSRAWAHTNEQVSAMLARAVKRGQKVSADNIFFTTKLLNLEGFDPKINRHLQVSLDPMYPDHMIRTMENILRVKSAHPEVTIVARIRSFHSTNADLNGALQAAVDFSNKYGIPVLETRMRFVRKSSLDLLELDKAKYKYDGSQYKMKAPALKEESEDYHLCDVKAASCPACKNCAKLVHARKTILPKQAKAIEAAGIDGIRIEDSQAFDPVGLTKEGKVPEFSLHTDQSETRTSAKQVMDTIVPILRSWTNFPTVRVVQTVDELPRSLRRQTVAQERRTKGKVEGMYDPNTDQVFLIADNLSKSRIEDVLRHEAEGHRGLRLMMGSGLDSFLDKVAAEKKADLQAMFPDLNFKSKAAVRSAANEWTARQIEAGTMKPLWHGRLVYAIRQWLRKFIPNMKMTDADIKTALYDVVMNVRKGAPQVLTEQQKATALASEKVMLWQSQMVNVLKQKLPGKGTPESFAQTIDAFVKKGEFKEEELEWSGVKVWLRDQKGKISKQDVLDYLATENVRIEEVEKGSRYHRNASEIIYALEELGYEIVYDADIETGQEMPTEIHHEKTGTSFEFPLSMGDKMYLTNNLPREDQKLIEGLERNSQLARVDDTKFGGYALPGGENYRELLLTMPRREKAPDVRWEENRLKDEIQYIGEYDGEKYIIEKRPDGAYRSYHMPEATLSSVTIATTSTLESAKRSVSDYATEIPPTYKSSHWDEENVVAHIRFDERTTPDGKKVLHIAEIQSDWHQEGRAEGYEKRLGKGDIEVKYFKSAVPEGQDPGNYPGYWESRDKNTGKLITRHGGGMTEAAVIAEAVTLTSHVKVPDAPFKKTWPLLTVKRMVRYAAEGGYDAVTWDTGEIQADRYDLSKQIDSLRYRSDFQGKFEIEAVADGVVVIDDNKLSPEGLERLVGKEVTERIVKDVGEEVEDVDGSVWLELSGVDLKIGGEGLKTFYDKQLPNVVNKFFNKTAWGKAKVGTTELEKGTTGIGERVYNGPEVSREQLQEDLQKPDGYGSAQLDKQSRQIALLMKGGDSFKTAIEAYGSIAFAEWYGGSLMSEYRSAKVHTLPVTPEMKTKAIHEGMPLFSTRADLTDRQRALLEKHYPEKLAAMDKKVGGTIIDESKEDFEHFAEMGEIPSSPEGFNMPHEGVGRQVFDLIQFKVQDRFNSLRKVQETIERQTATEIPEAANGYQTEELYHGIVSERVGAFDSEHVDPLIEAIHESGFELEEVEAYLYARHAKEANAQLEKINPKVKDNKALSGLSNEDAAAILARYADNKTMQDIAARIDAITKAGRDILVKEGLATAEQIAAWENLYDYYIPLKREGKAARLPKRGQGVNIAGPESKRRLTGSAERQAVNIVANVVSQHEAIIIRAEKAKVGRAMLKLAEAFPNKELWEVDAKQLKPFIKQRSSEEIDPETGLPQTLNEVVLGRDVFYKFNDNVLVIKVDGKERTITFNEKNVHAQRIVRGLKNLGAQDMNAFIGTLSKVNRWLAIVNTSANPEFIISNFARDIQTAGYNISDTAAKNMKRKVFKDVFRSLQGIRRGIRGDFSSEWAQEYKKFVKAGAQTGWTDHYKNIESREKSLKKQLDLMKDGTFRSVKRGAKGLMEFVSNENTAVENAIRLSVYKHLKDAGASDATAASAAKNLTVNFNRRGDMGQTLNALYLFFNANVQGSARLIYAAARSAKVRRMMYATVAVAVMLDILNRAIGGEDDDGENRYDKVPHWVKEHNLVLMRSNGDYFKIPLPWGYNTLHVLGQSIGEAVDPNADDFDAMAAAGRFGSAVLGSFNPLGSESTLLQLAFPTIADPFIQWVENKNFAGIPIKPEQMPFDVPKPEYQLYFQSARKPSKWIAKMLSDYTGGDEVRPGFANVSPEVIDLFLETVMGGAGRFMENTLALPAEFAKKKPEVRKMPAVRKVYGEAPDYYLRTKFYDNLSEIRYAQKSVDHYEDNPARLAAVKREYSWESRFIKRAKRDKKKIGDLRKKRKKIEASTESERVKEMKLQDIEKQITQIMTDFNRTYKKRASGAYMPTTPSMGAPYTPSTGLTLREAMQIK